MKRSTVNQAVKDAKLFFAKHHWVLPPNPRWDVTDFGLNNFYENGLVLVNLAVENEYCEKLMYARKNMKTPFHSHKKKKEDIIVRNGEMAIRLWKGRPDTTPEGTKFNIRINGEDKELQSGEICRLSSGERITLFPGIYHEFWPVSNECILGEVSTANDDTNDNFFLNANIGRFSAIDEDEPAEVKLISD